MAFDFNKLSPWKDIQDVTIDGQDMVRIPKFYVKVRKNRSGHKCWWVSPTLEEGFHIHPAFMHDGKELDQFYICKYEAFNTSQNMAGSQKDRTPWVNINFINAKLYSECRNHDEFTGWHLQNYYERSAISLLCMLELGTPDAQSKLGNGRVSTNALTSTGATGTIWRGINEMWGNTWELCDGIRTTSDGKTLLVQDNQGFGKFINTGVKLPSANSVGINTMQDAVGDEFDLSDMFIPKGVVGASADSVFRDMYYTAANDVYILIYGGGWSESNNAGLFCFYTAYKETDYGGNVSFRLAKW